MTCNMSDISTPKELRLLRKKTLAEIIARDLKGEDYEKLLADWSPSADKMIALALQSVLEGFASPPQFAVIGLGKLGSLELNYSSDVDLIFIYEGDFEEADRIASRLIRLLDDVTEDGFVFRVDALLRPRGKDGRLVNTIDALERYYETAGQEWERQMLVRARFVAGDAELGSEFIRRIHPFVFRRSIDISHLKKTRTIKMALERSAADAGWNNIKLGAGGIREVEFFVHTLQLLHGGKIKELQTQNTFKAMRALVENNIISKNKYDDLKTAWTLLRRTENLIQAKDDRQTHTLPGDPVDMEELAKTQGFDSKESFISELDRMRRLVQMHFAGLFESSFEKMEILDAMEANFETCKTKEELIDSLPWFKKFISKGIQEMDLGGKIGPEEVSERLTYLAEVVISEALKLSRDGVSTNCGTARTSSGLSAEAAIIGMGKLGTSEMDYASDLDLVFVYSEDGETDGERRITNHEYFTKVAQNVLSTINLPTRYGRAYNIDATLRPSGNQGALVASIESFERYHRREAGIWERQALLRGRVIAGDPSLCNRLSELLEDLVFAQPLPHNLKEELARVRQRAVSEMRPPPKGSSLDFSLFDPKVKSQDLTPSVVDIKLGIGGIADIESVVHYLTLLHGQTNKELRCKKISDCLDALNKAGILAQDNYNTLKEAHVFYKKLLSHVRLFAKHSSNIVDMQADPIEAVAASIGYKDKDEMRSYAQKLMKDVKVIYDKIIAG